MSGKVKNALYDLIQSMSKSEKRYFKLVSARHTIGDENNYVRLFDYLDKQDTYDEDKLFEDFKGESFINRFSITKKRLYDHILSALDSYHSNASVNAQLYKMLHGAEILFEKSLYDQCRRLLNSAEKLCEKNQLEELLIQVYALRRKLIETGGYLNVDAEEIDLIEEQYSKSLDSLNSFNKLWLIKSRLFERLAKKGVARCEREILEYDNICQTILEGFEDKDLTGEARYLYHHILSAYYFAIRKLDSSLKELQVNLGLLSNPDHVLNIEPNKHISVMTNAIYMADRLGNHKLAIQYLAQLKKFTKSVEMNEDLEIKLFSSISSIELNLKIRMGAFNDSLAFVDELEKNLERFKSKLNPMRRAFLAYKIAVVYIGNKDFNMALKWINRVLNDSEVDKTEDIIGFSQLLDLLIHIELNNGDLLPYSLKSTQRFFKTRGRMYEFEKAFLHFTSKLIKSKDVFEEKTLWENFNRELEVILLNNELEAAALEYFDFQSWAESKCREKAFELVVKEKYNQMRQAS